MTHIDPNGKLRGIAEITSFSEKDLSKDVLIATVMPLYRAAFLDGVWKEDLSVETVVERLRKNFSGRFKGIFLFDKGEICVAASWYEQVNVSTLRFDRGNELGSFAEEKAKEFNVKKFIWHAETIIHPNLKGLGLGSQIKKEIDSNVLQEALANNESILVCTRMRNDNVKIIKINEGLGYKRTGITKPCSLEPNIDHEFWYKIY